MAETLTIPEVAAELQMTPAGVYKLVQRGKLEVERLSARKTRVTRAALDEFIARHNGAVDALVQQTPDPRKLRDGFVERWGVTPETWIDQFRQGKIEDTAEHMDALVQAAALRIEDAERDGRIANPSDYPWAVAAFEVGSGRRST
ncbi:MAG TPA: helix-turn-helix domain-containing protein [Baekduia sp.]